MVEHHDENGGTPWPCAAWYYVPSVVRCNISASTADEALSLLRLKMDEEPHFWDHQLLDHNGASPNNIEIWNVGGKLVGAEVNVSLRVGDKEGLGYPRLEVNRIVAEINAFEAECQQDAYSDTGDVWTKLHDWRERLTKLFEPRDLPF